jgi:hypothetical protein
MAREVTIPATQVLQNIQSIEEYPSEKFVRVVVGAVNENGTFIVPQQFYQYTISNGDYEELVSANPSWNPEKPAGTYFNDDLWHFIDKQSQVG